MSLSKDIIKKHYSIYKNYVNKERATASIDDGLKPVQRRLLYSLNEISHDKFVKSATLVGHTMGRYHPHGDCLFGDTKFLLGLDQVKTIKELAEENTPVEIYSLVNIDNKPRFVKLFAKDFRIGQYTDTIYHIQVGINSDSVIKCTVNHPFLMADLTWKKAGDIKVGDKILYAYAKKTPSLKFDVLPVTISNITIEKVDNEPMYDFTVPHAENALILLYEDVYYHTVIAHNSSLYGTLVSMVNNGIVQGKGNFGLSFGLRDEPPAAMRYTEVKENPLIQRIAFEYIKEVDFIESEIPGFNEPQNLPTMVPLSLVGLSKSASNDLGIGVGLRSVYPTIHIKKLIELVLRIIDNKVPREIQGYYGDITVKIPLRKKEFKIEYISKFNIDNENRIIITSLAPHIFRKLEKFSEFAYIRDESTDKTKIIIQLQRGKKIGTFISEDKIVELLSSVVKYELNVFNNDSVIKISILDWMTHILNNYSKYVTSNLVKQKDKIVSELEMLSLITTNMDIIQDYIKGKRRTLPDKLSFVKQKTVNWLRNMNLKQTKKDLLRKKSLIERKLNDIDNVVYNEYDEIRKIV